MCRPQTLLTRECGRELSGLINGTYLIPSTKLTDKIIWVSGWEHNTIFIPIFLSESVAWCMRFFFISFKQFFRHKHQKLKLQKSFFCKIVNSSDMVRKATVIATLTVNIHLKNCITVSSIQCACQYMYF